MPLSTSRPAARQNTGETPVPRQTHGRDSRATWQGRPAHARKPGCAHAVVFALLAVFAGCRKTPDPGLAGVPASPAVTSAVAPGAVAQSAGAPAITKYAYEVRRGWPHDRAAFTQGLVFREGKFLESTGLNGRSSLREVEVQSGRILKQVSLPAQYFAEGLTVLGSKAYQVTWQGGKGFVYDADTFRLLAEFAYTGEGWGLATDGQALILSDGTPRIRFLDPVTFAVTRSIAVTAGGQPVQHLNELEFIQGEIFANVWQTDQVVRIDPATGQVRGVIDFAGLLSPQERGPDTDVLNGIAYDAASDRLFVTGKFWPRIFEVRLKVVP